MRKYTIEIQKYPQEFEVEAMSAEEAIEKAKQIFFDKNDGASVYSTEVTGCETLCPSGHVEDEDGRCDCTNKDGK